MDEISSGQKQILRRFNTERIHLNNDSKSTFQIYRRKEKESDKKIKISNEICLKILDKLEPANYKGLLDSKFIDTYGEYIKNGEFLERIKEEYNLHKTKEIQDLTFIENKLNFIKIYLDFKDIYTEEIFIIPISDFLKSLVFIEKEAEVKKDFETAIIIFDDLCKRLKMNLYQKIYGDRTFSDIFFEEISPLYYKFFNKFYMIRLFILMNENKKENNEYFSIINEKNLISKEIMSNLIQAIDLIKVEFDAKKVLNEIDHVYEAERKNEENSFLEKFSFYFGILLDYIFFEDTFLYSPENEDEDNDNDENKLDKTIFEKYIIFYDRSSAFHNDNYSYLYDYKRNQKENDFENKYKEWNKYIREEYKNEGLKVLFNLLDNQYFFKKSKLEFYESIFMFLDLVINSKVQNKENTKYINAIIKLILYDEKNILKQFMKSEKENKNKIFKRIIHNIRSILNKELNKENINLEELEYLNSLIVLLQSFGEFKNKFLLQFIFEQVEKNDEERPLFDNLISIYEKLLDDLKAKTEFNEEKINRLILFNSLTNCLNEYIELVNNNYEITNVEISLDIDLDKDVEINEYDYIDDYLSEDENIAISYEDKINEIKINELSDIKNKKNIIYDLFILENHLIMNIHLIKILQYQKPNVKNKFKHIMKKLGLYKSYEQNKDNLSQALKFMNICFENLIILENKLLIIKDDSLNNNKSSKEGIIRYEIDNNYNNKEDEINNNNDNNEIFDIRNKVNYLLSLYKGDKLINKDEYTDVKHELLTLIFLNYQKIFYLINSNSFDLKEFNYIIKINENDSDIRKTLNLLEFVFKHEKNNLIVLISFLEKIHDFIEIKIDGVIHNYLNLINLEYLQISENSKNYFYSLIDYSSSETKLTSIYNYIECIIYDINRKKLEKDENIITRILYYPKRNWNCINKYSFNQFKLWEVLNIIAFIILNGFLISFYKKSRNEDEENYNKIDNRQNFLLTTIWPIVHCFILIIIFIYWCISRFKIDYFYSMIKYSNEYFEESQKLKMDEKAKLLKKPQSNFSYINNFFPKKQEEQIKSSFDERNFFEVSFEKCSYFYTNWIKVAFSTSKTIYPFVSSFIFLLLSFWSQIFLIIPLFLIFNLSENLSSIFLLFTNQALRLFLIAMFFLLILYIFSWFGFFFLPKMFKYEAVDKNNELINADNMEENICSSTISCILYFLNFGFRDNLMDMNLFSFKNEINYYFIQFFFTIFLYAFIHLIFDNIFLATISSAFDEMKEEIDKKDNENENVCFICSKTRNDCMKENKDFEEHLQKHDMWKYIRYICSIILKNKDDYTEEEYYVWKQIKKKNLDWFPTKEEEKFDFKKLIGIIQSKQKNS